MSTSIKYVYEFFNIKYYSTNQYFHKYETKKKLSIKNIIHTIHNQY